MFHRWPDAEDCMGRDKGNPNRKNEMNTQRLMASVALVGIAAVGGILVMHLKAQPPAVPDSTCSRPMAFRPAAPQSL